MVKPIAVMKWIMNLLVGGRSDAVVLDPFAGSGTTLLAGIQEGIRTIGIEQEGDYIDIAAARMTHIATLT